MNIINGLHTHKKLTALARELSIRKEPAIILTEHKTYVEDIFLAEMPVLFDIQIMNMKDYVQTLHMTHHVFNRKVMDHTRLTLLTRRALKMGGLHFFRLTDNPYNLIDEIIKTLKDCHQNNVTFLPETTDALIIGKCHDLQLLDQRINEMKDSYEYWTLEETARDLIDASLVLPVYVLGDDYITNQQHAFFAQLSAFIPVTILSPSEENDALESWMKDVYRGDTNSYPLSLTPLEETLMHHLFDVASVYQKQNGRLITAGHPQQECEKVVCDIKKRLVDENAHYADFMIITNQDACRQYLKAACETLNLPHNISDIRPFSYDQSYRLITNQLSSMQGEMSLHEIVTTLMALELDEGYRRHLLSLDTSDTMTIAEFGYLLDMTLKNTEIRAERTDAIQIVSLRDAKRATSKHLYLIGLNEAQLPEVMKDHGLLQDIDYDTLSPRPLNLIERLGLHYNAIIQALIMPTKSYTFSYSKMTMDGKDLMPSTLMHRLNDIFSLQEIPSALSLMKNHLYLTGSFLPDDLIYTYAQDYRHNKNQPSLIRRENIDALGKGISISRIETYNKCPFQYYAKYGLKLDPPFEDDLQSWELGSLCHHIMETCLEDPDRIEEEAMAYITKELQEKYDASPVNRYIIHRVIRNMKTNVQIIRNQLNESDFRVADKELPIEGAIGNVPFLGIIDRLDVYDNALRIIDYKSSAKKIDLNLAMQGFNIQMLVYLQMISQQKKMEKAGALYFNMRPRKLSPQRFDKMPSVKDLLKLYKMSGYVIDNAHHDYAKAMESIAPVSFKTNGDLTSHSSVITDEHFEVVMKEIYAHTENLYDDLRAGNIQILPAKLEGNGTDPVYPCTYCDYHALCLFDVFLNENKIVQRVFTTEEGDDDYA